MIFAVLRRDLYVALTLCYKQKFFTLITCISAAQHTKHLPQSVTKVFVCGLVCAVSDGRQRDDHSDDSKSSGTKPPLRPVAKRRKPAAGTSDSSSKPAPAVRPRTTILPLRKEDMSTATDQETATVKPPVPTSRKKTPPAVSGKGSSGADKQAAESELSVALNKMHRRAASTGHSETEKTDTVETLAEKTPGTSKRSIEGVKPAAETSELSAVLNRMHRRAASTGNTETDKNEPVETVSKETSAEKPVAKTTAPQQIEKSEPGRKIYLEKLTTKMKEDQSTEKSELIVEPSVKAEKQPRTEVGKLTGKDSGVQTTGTNDVKVTKPTPPAKTGLLSEKVESTIKSSASRVVGPTLSQPGSTKIEPSQKRTETGGESVEDAGKRSQTSGLTKVKLKPTSSTALGSRPMESDAVVAETKNVVENDKKQDTSGCVLSAENRVEQQNDVKNSESDVEMTRDTDRESSRTATSGPGPCSASSECAVKTVSDRTKAAESKPSDSVSRAPESGGKSDQPGLKLKPSLTAGSFSSKQAGVVVARVTWEQKVASSVSSTTAEVVKSSAGGTGPEADKTLEESRKTSSECRTVAEDASSFVPVSKRATIFGSSLQKTSSRVADGTSTAASLPAGRQNVSKATGFTEKLTIVDNSDRNIQTDADETSDCSTGASTGLSKAAVSQAAPTASNPPASHGIKSSVTKTESCGTRDKLPASTTQSVQPTLPGTCEAKNEVVIKAAETSRWAPTKSDVKTSVPSWVKPSGTSSPKNLRKDSSVETTSSSAEPDKAAGTVMSQKLSSVPAAVKPFGTSSPKNIRKDSPQETSNAVESGKVTSSSSQSSQSAKPSGTSHSGSATTTKTTSSLVAGESLSSVPKNVSASDGAPVTSAVRSLSQKSKRNLANESTTEPPVTSSVPSWIALAEKKTRVWTDGKILD